MASIQLMTGYMQYRENTSDSWHPLVVYTTPESGTVSYSTAQSLTTAQKQRVWSNIDVASAVEKNVLIITTPSFDHLQTTFSHPAITSDHVVAQAIIGNPQAQKDDWTISTGNGQLTITGTINGETNIKLLLVKALSGNAM